MKFPCIIWALTRENLSSWVSNNKDADQSARPCRLISTFVIHLLESIISKILLQAKFQFSSWSVAEEIGLSFALSKTLKTGFVLPRPTL